MSLDQKDGQLMRDAFYDALDKWHSKNKGGSAVGGGGGGNAAPPAGTSLFGKAMEGAAGAAKSFGTEAVGAVKGLAGGALDLGVKMAKGGLSVTDATKTMGSSLKEAGFAGAKLTGALGSTVSKFGDLINYVEEGLDTFRDLSKVGATFNNSVVDMRAAAAGSRLTMQEFGNIIKENNTSFLALGNSGEQGAKAFARLSKGFFDSGFGDKLTQLGYTSEDLNKLMAIQMTNMSARELKEKGGEAAQFAATAKLAEEMDLMAKLTGKSRKEQEETLAKAKASGQVQAAIQLEAMNGNAKASEAFDAVATSVSGQFGDLVQQMVTSGRPLTEESRKQMGMLSAETQAAIQEARDAYKRGDVEGAREAAKRAQALESAEAATNKSRLTLAAQGVKGFEESTKEGIRYGKALAEKAKELGTSVTDPKAIEAARKALEDEAKKEQAARSGETASVIEAQNRIKDMGSAIQESIIVPLTKEANKRALDDFYNTLAKANQSAANGGTAGSDKGFAGDVSKTVQPAVEGIKSAISRLMDEKGPDQKFSSEAAKAANQAQADALKKAIGGTSRQQVAGEANDIRALGKSLKAVDGEAVSKQLEKIAKDQGKSSADVLKEAVNKPGGVGNLNKALAQDPAAKKVLDDAAAADKKEQAAKELTNKSASKGRDTTGTSGEAAAKTIGSALGSLTTGTIELFKVQGDVKIDTAKLPGAAEGGVLKGPESGYLAMLHGEETVIPNKDIDAVISGAISKLPKPNDQMSMSENTDRAYKAMQSMDPAKMFAELRAATSGGGKGGGVNLNEISKNISTSISSSVAGGGSSTGQRVQSDDSKAAEKELDALWKQFGDDWAKRKDQVIEGMAVEDRKFSKVQAAMKADETAMKIKEDYEKKKAELQKKVDDGIKWEVSTKEAAVEETEKILSKELLMLKAQGLEKLAITEFNEEEIAKMLEQSGEDLNNFYIDMNGDLKSWADETTSAFGQGMSDAEAMLAEQSRLVNKNIASEMSNAEAMLAEQDVPVNKNIANEMAASESTLAEQSKPVDKEAKKEKSFTDILAEKMGLVTKNIKGFMSNAEDMLTSQTKSIDENITKGMSDTEAALSMQGKSVDKTVSKNTTDTKPVSDEQAKPVVDKPVVGGMNFESMFNPVRTSAQSMMEKFGKENEQKKAEESKAAADKAAAKPGNAEKKADSKPAPAASKADSTLNDVVKSLDRLNMMMGQLLSQSEDLGKKQLRASKANSVQP